MKAAICYFVYNRLDKVEITLAALTKCIGIEETPICIIQDNCKNYEDSSGVEEVKAYIKDFIEKNPQLQVEYIQWKRNAGAYISLNKGFEYALNKYGRALRIEDDIVVREDYLVYMNAALDYYENDPEVFAVCAYNPEFVCEEETFLSKRLTVFGYGTWKNRMAESGMKDGYLEELFNHIDKEDCYMIQPHMKKTFDKYFEGIHFEDMTEDVRLRNYVIAKRLYCVYSNISHCKNIGFDGTGITPGLVSCHENKNFDAPLKTKYNFGKYKLSQRKEWEHVISWAKTINTNWEIENPYNSQDKE